MYDYLITINENLKNKTFNVMLGNVFHKTTIKPSSISELLYRKSYHSIFVDSSLRRHLQISYQVNFTINPEFCYLNLVSLEKDEGSSSLFEEKSYDGVFQNYLLTSITPSTINTTTYKLNMSNTQSQNTANSPFVVSSFGSLFSVNLQSNSFNNKITLYSLTDKAISEEDFNNLLNNTIFDYRIFHEDETSYSVELFNSDKSYLKIFKNKNTGYCNVSIFYGEKDIYDILSNIKTVKNKSSITWVTSVQQGRIQSKTLKAYDLPMFTELAYSCFNQGVTVDQFMKDYLESNSSVLLLYGPPGTGKTSLLRQLLKVSDSSALLTYNDDVAELDELFSYFHDSPEKFLIIEDADNYIASRSSGNSNMKKLLNITDGLTANPEKKVIFSSNETSLSRIDTALLRPGRCFGTLKIDILPPERIHEFLTYINRSDLIKEFNNPASLAEVYNMINGYSAYAVQKVYKMGI